MRAKKLFAVALSAALALSMSTVAFANEGSKWSISGLANNDAEDTDSVNKLAWYQGDASNYVYQVWSKNGTSEGAKISQKVKITEAGKYTLTMDIMGGDGDGITVTPFIGDNKGVGTATTGWSEDPSTWQSITFTADLDAGVYDVGASVDLSASNAWGYIDNISLKGDSGEVLNKGDFEISQDEWEDYVGDDASFDDDADTSSDDDADDTTSDDGTVDDVVVVPSNDCATADTVASTGDASPFAMAGILVLAAGAVVVLKKRSEA